MRPSNTIRFLRGRRIGLTLLELMVVLVILAIVATIAVQSLQPQVDNQRFNSASRILNEVQSATIGPLEKFQVDGTPLISGFVADVGRLPRAESASANATQPDPLGELWQTDSQLALKFPFEFRAGPKQPVDYSAIRLPCGWRGPYLQLPVGTNSIRDPWGQSPKIVPAPNGLGQQIQIELPSGFSISVETAVATSNPGTGLASEETSAAVLTRDLTGGMVEVTGKVLLDNPNSSTVQAVMLTPDPETSLTTLTVLVDEDDEADSFRFVNVPVGLRAIVIDADGRRQTKYLQVPHRGANTVFDFRKQESAN